MPNCKTCGQPTPSNTRTCCDNCLSPASRAALSLEARANLSQAHKGNTLPAWVRAKISTAMKSEWGNPESNRHSAEYAAKLSAAATSQWESPCSRAVILAAVRIAARSPERNAKLSQSTAQAVADGRCGFKGLGHQTQYTSKAGIEYTLRSSWEYKTAEYLDAQDLIWEYELDVLILGDDVYIPDFFIFDKHGGLVKIIEVKGYFPPESQAKMKRCQKQLASQGIPLDIWDEPKLKELGIL